MTQPCLQSMWEIAPVDDDIVDVLARETGLSRIAARILALRSITSVEQARRFLEPALESDWHDPSLIPGMQDAARRVVQAVRDRESILVFGDFDLDGVSAAAVCARGLAAMGARVSAIVPHRFTEGYGLSAPAIERVLAAGPSLVVTVDCGISSAEEVAQLKSAGVDVVVTDHHQPGEGVPVDVPVANPKLDDSCPSWDLAGAGVALKLVQAVGASLGFPDTWRSLTDLAMLGTVADIVPLVGENRALVTDGLRLTRSEPRVCISSLAGVAGVTVSGMTSEQVGYSLAPRLNAAGRMADSQVALDLLLADEPQLAEGLAEALDGHNKIRQAVEAELSQAAEAMAERTYKGERALVLAGEGWHEGVKGIVASRLMTRYRVPTFLFTIEDGVAKGSGRSVGDVDLYEATSACADLLLRFGGHRAAVGLALPAADLPRFREALLGYLDGLPAEQFTVTKRIDAVVPLDALSVELGAELARFEPFGQANRRPLLLVDGVFMNGRSRVGASSDHLRFTAFDGVASVPAIAFRCRDIDSLVEHDDPVDIAFELGVDEWRGRKRVQMIVRDVAQRPVDREYGGAAALVEDLFSRADEILARESYAGIEEAPSFHTKLAGVTFEGRQELLAGLDVGAPLRLERQPANEHDHNACALYDPTGAHIGFLNRRLASILAPAIDAGVEYDVEVSDVTGGGADKALGVNVLLTRRDAAASDEETAILLAQARMELSALPADELEAELVRRFIGDRSLHEAQVRALASLGEGRNTMAVMATGRGKSLIFHLHAARLALRENRASVFVFPLRALVSDQAFHLSEAFSAVGLTVRTVTGETAGGDRDAAFAALADGDLDCILTTPEFLHFHAGRFAAASRVGFVVVDEAHHVGQSRAGNRPAYARLGDALALLGHPTVLAVTATASDEITETIRTTLGIESFVLDPTVRENLVIEDKRECKDKDAHVGSLAEAGGKTVVYVNSRDKSVQIARMLRKRVPGLGYKTAFYNGGLSRSIRHAVERAFREGELQVVVATSAFGEGVNIPDVRNVVLYHLPFNEVEFNQMSGRAGRDGATARVHLLYGERDAKLNERILSSLAPEREDLAVLYRVLREIAEREGEGFEITNAELAEKCSRAHKKFALDERGVSSALGIFRDLGFLTSEGHGGYRRLTLLPSSGKVELTESVRYAEGLDEIAQFSDFREWATAASAEQLLQHFNRPILPTRAVEA